MQPCTGPGPHHAISGLAWPATPPSQVLCVPVGTWGTHPAPTSPASPSTCLIQHPPHLMHRGQSPSYSSLISQLGLLLPLLPLPLLLPPSPPLLVAALVAEMWAWLLLVMVVAALGGQPPRQRRQSQALPGGAGRNPPQPLILLFVARRSAWHGLLRRQGLTERVPSRTCAVACCVSCRPTIRSLGNR